MSALGRLRRPAGPRRRLRRPTLRRVLSWLATLIVAFAGLVAVVVFFTERDRSTFHGPAGPGARVADQGDRHLPAGHAPVSYAHDPPVSGPHAVVPVRLDRTKLTDDELLTTLERGNVVLAYPGARPPAGLVALQHRTAGPFSRTLARAGEAVVLARRPGQRGVLALAWDRELKASSPRDPRLREFVDAWIGRGA